jgi:hypothetical protein
MKVIGVVLLVLAVFVAIFPHFYTCQHWGHAIQLPAGTVPMKCLWSAHAMTSLAIMVAITAGGLLYFKEKGARTILSILGIVGGLLILLTVTKTSAVGIGVCVNPDMPCVIYMRPAIYTVAPLIMAASAAALGINLRPLGAGGRRRE